MYLFIMLHDIPAYFARTPETFRPIDAGLRAAPPAEEKTTDTEWVEGSFSKLGEANKALRISGSNRTWKIPLGEKAGEASRERFNVKQGTVEFFVKINTPPDLCTATGIPFWLEFEKKTTFHFWHTEPASFFTLEPVSAILISNNYEARPLGNLGQSYPGIGMTNLTSGQWYHLAFEWTLNDGNDKLLRRAYLNGVPFKFESHAEPYPAWPTAFKMPPQIDDHIRITSRGHDLTVDELRISDIPRYGYDETFKPPAEPYKPDKHTLLLMHLDGNMDAAGK